MSAYVNHSSRPTQDKPQHSKPKLSRISTIKVRTGCTTCKKRHIKCDEAKPYCNNCLKNKGYCEGYTDQQSKKRNSPGPIQLCWDSKQITRAAPPLAQLKLHQDSHDFQDTKSVLYFQEFVHLMQGPWITAGCNSDLWAVTLPQLGRRNGTLRHAAIGIGALSMWYRKSKHEALRTVSVPVRANTEGDAHYFLAVAHYCHALKLQSQKASLQDAVILSVLFLYFELLRGHTKAALDHVNHGSALLLAMLTDQDSHRHVAALAPNPKPLLIVLADIFSQLITQTRFVLRASLGHGPPLPNFTKGLRDKKHTIESFLILISQLPRYPATNGDIPTVFSSLDEFEEYWITTRGTRAAIGPLLLDVIQNSGVLSSNEQADITRFWSTLTGDSRIKEFCKASTRELQALDAAFLPLFNQMMISDAESPAYLRAVHLRLQYLGVYAFENPTQYHNVETLHAQTPLFREYLSLAGLALRIAKRDLKNPAQQLSLQCGLAWHLLLVAFFCRDPVVREEATWMLKDYPGQDGIWNAHSLYALALRNKMVERMNATEGTPVEQWHRLWRREYLFEDGGDRVVFCFLTKDEVAGEWRVVEETAVVKEEPQDVRWERRPLTASGRLLMGDIMVL
ncbi:hypothetical protein EDB81DRAFT_719459 [Dactylonectria macrodidyma]|uniref:Zn(2)-C6 fungal-type domain-containing protein n=1 Tax=Dactylonectria macrodidyma TaxID=307937 RepID=A0A9P9JBI5_9HYPO|nr:hypothetical protein EDB81DRAFT_719459 [Dactylonectria macrodidyma]